MMNRSTIATSGAPIAVSFTVNGRFGTPDGMVVGTLPTRIVKYPDPRLRKKSAPIEEFGDSVAALAQRMLELMHACRGVGLAAPQVGISRRIIVCNPTGEPADQYWRWKNPRFDALVDRMGQVPEDSPEMMELYRQLMDIWLG